MAVGEPSIAQVYENRKVRGHMRDGKTEQEKTRSERGLEDEERKQETHVPAIMARIVAKSILAAAL
jgi:hypothetical protein